MSEHSGETLPPAFADLGEFATAWGGLNDAAARYAYRQTLSMAELQAFYDAISPRLPAIFAHLDQFPLNDIPPSETALLRTALGVIEAAEAVEFFGQPRMAGAPFPHQVIQQRVDR